VGGNPIENPASPPTRATGSVTITPGLGVQPVSPAGSVIIPPQLGFSMPTLTGFVPITPGGTIMAHRMTNPHGMFFGHTQHWPNDVFHHSRQSAPYEPPTVPMAPWVPVSGGYAETFSTPKTDFDQNMGRGVPIDMRSQYSMDIDQTQDIEQNRQVTYNETVDQTLDQSMNTVVERSDRSVTQNEFDNSTRTDLDLSADQTTQHTEKVTQVENRNNEFSTETNVSNEQDNSRSFTNRENRETTMVSENTDVRNVDASRTTTENNTVERVEQDNSRTEVITELHSSLAYNDTHVNEVDNSRREETTTAYNFTDQDNSRTTYVNDNDTVLEETRSVTMAFPESRTLEADNSTSLTLVNNFENVDRSSSEINNIDASQTNFVTTEDPTYVFDNSSRTFLNFDAPERIGGDIVAGNA
jgi:hypothetical protein